MLNCILLLMRREIFAEIEIPHGVEVKLDGEMLVVKGPQGENKKKFSFKKLFFEIKDKKIKIGSKIATKREKKMINTNEAHINNMIKGVQEKYEYKLKVCFNHFPITVSAEKNLVSVKNFLGEKTPRKVLLPAGADVKINKDLITITSTDKEIAGQAAANLETVTRIRLRDRRVFQDGIFITNKAGEEM